MDLQPSDIDVVFLCGGLGTRLQTVISDRPKPMAAINNRPFLEILLDQFSQYGFRRFILCTGHLSSVVRSHFQNTTGSLEVVISEEPAPLGTAGAVKLAENYIRSDPFIVANGDSFCNVDLLAFLRFHRSRHAELSMVVTHIEQACDYGTVRLDKNQRIANYSEKVAGSQAGLISAGIYLFNESLLERIPAETKCSLELDVFPNLTTPRSYGFLAPVPVMDIGTPERFSKATAQFSGTDFTDNSIQNGIKDSSTNRSLHKAAPPDFTYKSV